MSLRRRRIASALAQSLFFLADFLSSMSFSISPESASWVEAAESFEESLRFFVQKAENRSGEIEVPSLQRQPGLA